MEKPKGEWCPRRSLKKLFQGGRSEQLTGLNGKLLVTLTRATSVE